jgi:hypothetical protein
MDEATTKAGVVIYRLPPPTQLPRSFALQTREGVQGLLQLTGFTEEPRGLTIRYKLVQNSTAKVADAKSAAAPDYSKALSIFYSVAGIAEFLDRAIKNHDNPKLAAETASQILDRLREYNRLVKGTPVEVPAKDLEAWSKLPDTLNAGKWDEAASFLSESASEESLLPKLEELAQNQSAGTVKNYFAPFTELELPFEGETPETACLDFDTGRIFNLPKNLTIEHSYLAWSRWFADTGADVYAENPRSGPVIWGEPGCVFFREEPEKWEKLTAPQLVKDSANVSFIPEAEMNPSSLPATFLFKTRQHGIGILQVTGFSAAKRGLNLRYKLVQNAAISPPIPAAARDSSW